MRRVTPLKDVRDSRWGRSGEVIVDLIKEWGLADATVGISHVDPVYGHHLPVDEWERLRDGLPEATLERVGDFFHELVHVKSPEEIEYVRKAGKLMDQAFHAMIAAARPGVTEYQLAAAATHAVMDGGGQMDFNIIGSTRMDDPAMVFGNPWPSSRPLETGDIIINELACGYNGYSVQIGSPICIGEPPSWIREFFDDVVLPGYDLMADCGACPHRARRPPRSPPAHCPLDCRQSSFRLLRLTVFMCILLSILPMCPIGTGDEKVSKRAFSTFYTRFSPSP